MDSVGLVAYLSDLIHRNLHLSMAIGALLVIALVKKPKLVLSGVGMAIFVAGIFYFISILSAPGVTHKAKMVSRSTSENPSD